MGRGCCPCGGLGRRRGESCPSVPRSALWGGPPVRRRPQHWREQDLSTARRGGSPQRSRRLRLRQRLGSGRQEASGTVADVRCAAYHSCRRAVELGRRRPLIGEDCIPPGMAVCWELTWIFWAPGFPLIFGLEQAGRILRVGLEACFGLRPSLFQRY